MTRNLLITLGVCSFSLLLAGGAAAADESGLLAPLPPPVVIVPPPAATAAPPAAVSGAPAPAVLLPAVEAPRPQEDEEEPLFDTAGWPDWAATAWEGSSDVLHDHLRIGLRYRQVRPTDGSRSLENSFLGSITELKPLRDYDAITYLTFDWLATPYVGVRFNLEQLRSKTGTTSYDNHTDGDVNLEGPQLTLLLRYPNRTRFTPSVGLGYAWFDSTFEHNPVWYNGFGGETKQKDYDAWRAAGSPPWPNHGYRREIILDDTTALILMGELEVRLTDHLEATLFIQNMEVQEVGVTYNLSFGGNVFESTQAKFPMSNIGYGGALRWTF